MHSDRKIETTRLALERAGEEGPEFFLVKEEPGQWSLPGGKTFVERAIPDWDKGNVIASLQKQLRETLRIETPWVSYVGDFEEGEHLCRVYGYTLNGLGFPVPYREGEWLDATKLQSAQLRFGYERRAVDAWLDPVPIRGKGLSQAQSRVDQYAY